MTIPPPEAAAFGAGSGMWLTQLEQSGNFAERAGERMSASGLEYGTVPIADMRAAEEADGGHAGGHRPLDTGRAILDHGTMVGLDAHTAGRQQEDIRSWLAIRDLAAAEQVAAKMGSEPELLGAMVEPFDTARRGDAELLCGVRCEKSRNAWYGLHIISHPIASEGAHPVAKTGWQWPPEVIRDALHVVLSAPPHIARH